MTRLKRHDIDPRRRWPLLLTLTVVAALLFGSGAQARQLFPTVHAQTNLSANDATEAGVPSWGLANAADDRSAETGYGQVFPLPYPPPPPPPPPAAPAPPAIPLNVQAASTQPTNITFAWTPGDGNAAGFVVYAPYPSALETTVGAASFTLSNLSPGGYYCLIVAAYNASGYSGWSNWNCTTTPFAAAVPNAVGCPTGFILSQSGCTPFPQAACVAGFILSQLGCTQIPQPACAAQGACIIAGPSPASCTAITNSIDIQGNCLPGTTNVTCPPGYVLTNYGCLLGTRAGEDPLRLFE